MFHVLPTHTSLRKRKFRTLYRGGKLRIFQSLRAFIQGESYIRRLAPRSAPLDPIAYLGSTFTSPRAYNVGREGSEFFQVPKPICRGGDLRIFPRTRVYIGRGYSFIFSAYFFISLHIFHIFLPIT